MAVCAKHPFESATARCSACEAEFCPECLIYPFGEKKPPLCVPCALVVGGVRRRGRLAS